MKLKVLSILSAILILSLFLGMTAYALDDTTQIMTITYTKEESDASPSLPVYEVFIPAAFSLNENSIMPIYLTENNLQEGQGLSVLIDGAKTLREDKYVHLDGTKGQTPAKVLIGCYYNGRVDYLNFWGQWGVATFESGKNLPASGGTIFFEIVNDKELIADTYTGRVHFIFRLYDE